MKINNALNTQLQTNVKATSLDFGIGDPAMVIEILRKRLYSNPIQTLVQEYISNARDACRESGLPEKITVTIPSPNNKVFRVRDYGCGISPERIANVFVNYCSSTKRADNTQTGGFGIGAKSAWAYTDNFQVISYYNGIAYHYSAHLGKKNSGTMDLINESPTSEPNGTEIQVAVGQYDLESFARAVYRCTFFWQTRPKIRGVSPTEIPVWYKTLKPVLQVDNITFYNVSNYTKDSRVDWFNFDLLVIDGIPYPLPVSINVGHNTDYKCALNVPSGVIEVSANRETLSDHAENRDAMQTLVNQSLIKIDAQLKTELNKCQTLRQFIKVYGAYNEVIDVEVQDYKAPTLGVSLQNGKVCGQIHNTIESVSLALEKVRNKDDKYRLESYDKVWSNMHEYEIFYADKDVGKAVVYSKVRQYLLSLPSDTKRQAIVLSSDDKVVLLKYALEFEAIPLSSVELERKIPSVKKPAGQIIVHTFADPTRYGRGGRGHEGTPIDLNTNTKRFVYAVKKSESTEFTTQKSALKSLATVLLSYCDMDLGFVSESAEKKIVGNDNFITVYTFWQDPCQYLTDKGKQHFKSLIINEATTDINDSIAYLVGRKEFKQRQSSIKDTELQSAIDTLNQFQSSRNNSSRRNESNELIKLLNVFDAKYPKYRLQADAIKAKMQAFDKYPLLRYLDSSFEISYKNTDDVAYDDLILYLNTKYETK
jgi:hypothetical protein